MKIKETTQQLTTTQAPERKGFAILASDRQQDYTKYIRQTLGGRVKPRQRKTTSFGTESFLQGFIVRFDLIFINITWILLLL